MLSEHPKNRIVSNLALAATAAAITAACTGARTELENTMSERDAQADSQQDAQAHTQTDASEEKPVSKHCNGISITKDSQYNINQSVSAGDHPFALGCWAIHNPCPEPISVGGASFWEKGTAPVEYFTNFILPKISDKAFVNPTQKKVTFPKAVFNISPETTMTLCLTGFIAPEAACNTYGNFQLNSAADLVMSYGKDVEPITSADVKTPFPVIGGENKISCTKLFNVEINNFSQQTTASVGQMLQCLTVDTFSSANFEIIFQNFTASVEFQGNTTPQGGLIDTTDPANPKANVGPMQVLDNDGHVTEFAGNPEISTEGNDFHLEYKNLNPAVTFGPHEAHRISLVLNIHDVQSLAGNQIRCVFKKNPLVTDSAGHPLSPLNVGPDTELQGSWVLLTN